MSDQQIICFEESAVCHVNKDLPNHLTTRCLFQVHQSQPAEHISKTFGVGRGEEEVRSHKMLILCSGTEARREFWTFPARIMAMPARQGSSHRGWPRDGAPSPLILSLLSLYLAKAPRFSVLNPIPVHRHAKMSLIHANLGETQNRARMCFNYSNETRKVFSLSPWRSGCISSLSRAPIEKQTGCYGGLPICPSPQSLVVSVSLPVYLVPQLACDPSIHLAPFSQKTLRVKSSFLRLDCKRI